MRLSASSMFAALAFALLVVVSAKLSIFEALERNDVKAFTLALEASEDVNAPSHNGKTALIESAKLGETFLEMALEYGAIPNVKELGTGKTALHYAMQEGKTEIAKKLLAWGADPDLKAQDGSSPRDVAARKGSLQAVLDLFDKEGAVAFEDPPGYWLAGWDEQHDMEFFHNEDTKRSLWRRGPSLSWTSADISGARIYVNSITHQTMWKLPDALAWRHVAKDDGSKYWFNFRTNQTSATTPAELNNEMLTEALEASKTYWFNEVSGDTAYEKPVTSWTKLTDPDNENTYYYNTESKETTWEAPVELAWRDVHSEEHDRTYYFNSQSGETSWEKPAHMAWRIVTDEL